MESDSRRETDTQEDLPPMRAVAMMSGPSVLPVYSEPQGISFGKAPPLGISRPFKGSLRKELKSKDSGSDMFGVKQEWTGVTAPSVWNVKAEDLGMVPEDFPLERTHREISEDPVEVASRISEALRVLSIEAEYCDKDKAKAKCKTVDQVGFRIRLYAGGESGQPVVVEVQRRCGSSSSFMRSCRAILAAAEGKKLEKAAQSKLLPFMNKPIGQMKCLQGTLPSVANHDQVAADAMDGAMNMLRSNQRDSNILGLENLCSLTDPVKTTPTVAVRISKCVILGDDKYDIREEIRVLTERDVFVPEFEEEEGIPSHFDNLRSLALSVFSNALAVCAKDGCLDGALRQQKWFEEYLIPSLIDELKVAETNANGAYQAASCLRSLTVSSGVARRLVSENGGLSVLKNALEVGEQQHELLASQARLCLKTIDRSPSAA